MLNKDIDDRQIDDRRMLRLSDAAQRIGVSPRTVERWVESEGLPAYRVPGRGSRTMTLIDLADLEDWLRQHRVAQADPKQVVRLDGRRFFSAADKDHRNKPGAGA